MRSAIGGSEATLEIPKINISGLVPAGHGWAEARAEAMRALESYGCFDAVYEGVTPELQEAFFGHALKELFSLPKDTMMLNTSDLIVHGYVGDLAGKVFDSLYLQDVTDVAGADKFTHLMWPTGNPRFRDTTWEYANKLKDLDRMVGMMIAESYGLEMKHYELLMESFRYAMRVSHYAAPSQEEQSKTASARGGHKDVKFLGIVCQHHVAGLEVETESGEWIRVLPSSNTFTVIVGESMEVWTNGRLRAPVYRTKMMAKEDRYSAVFGAHPKDGYELQAPEEVVDEEHPLIYNNFDYMEYVAIYGPLMGANRDALKLYCGLDYKPQA